MRIIRRIGRFFYELYNGKPLSNEEHRAAVVADLNARRDLDGTKYSLHSVNSRGNGLGGV
jgi:hypothetical protein